MGNSPINQPTPFLVKGSTRQFPIPSCSLRAEDLRRLYNILEKRAGEAKDFEVGALRQQPGQSGEQFELAKNNVALSLKLVVSVQSITGDWVGGVSGEAFSDASLPDSIARITFDSAFLYRTQFKLEPQNSFNLTLDFSRTRILDLTNIALSPEMNQSSSNISGVNDGWVKAVHDDLRTFFDERATPRGWLHRRFSYDLSLLALGFPASLASCYHIAKWIGLRVTLPQSIAVPLYVALFLVSLLVFRFAFNYAKWVFPKVEGPSRRTWPILHRSLLALIGASLVSLVVESLAGILRVSWFGQR
jgi:hypothetical protein